MAGHAALHRLAEVLPQVEPVGDLHRIRRAKANTLGVGAGAVPADHLDTPMGPQPVRQRLRLPTGQQLHRRAGLAIDQHGAIDLATAKREIVHPKHPRRDGRRLGIRQGQQQPQQRRPAGGGVQPPGEPSSGATGQRDRDLLQQPAQQRRPSSIGNRQARDLLDERPPIAGGVVAKPAPDRQHQHRPAPAQRHIGQPPPVATVHPARQQSTGWARCRASPSTGKDPDEVRRLLDPLDVDTGQVREQVRNEGIETLVVTCSGASPIPMQTWRRFHHEMWARSHFSPTWPTGRCRRSSLRSPVTSKLLRRHAMLHQSHGRTNGRPTAQWSRLEAGRLDDLGPKS